MTCGNTLIRATDPPSAAEPRFELQVKTTLANLDLVLEHFWARRSQIVETTVLVRNLRENFDATARLHAE